MKAKYPIVIAFLLAPIFFGSFRNLSPAPSAVRAAADSLAVVDSSAIDTSLFVLKDTVMYVSLPYEDTLLSGKSIFGLLHGVTLNQNISIRSAMAAHVSSNADRKMEGYRIRIFFDNKRNARSESEKIEKEFRFLFPELRAYRNYDNPYFKVTVGDFRTRSEAMAALNGIKMMYPAAFLVKEAISYPPLDKDNAVRLDTVTLVIPKEAAEPSGKSVFF